MHSNRVIALVVAALVSTASFAEAQGTAPGTGRSARAQGKVGVQRAGRDALLRGVSLSEAEKATVKEIQARYRTEVSSLHESMKPAMVEARAARKTGDTATVRAVLERTKADREKARALRVRHIAEVRGALSSENQKAFDANVKQAKHQVGKRMKQGRGVDGKAGRKAGRALGRTRPNG